MEGFNALIFNFKTIYRIDILDKDFNALTTIWQQSVYNFNYVNELKKHGSAEFTIKLRDTKATPTNLNLYNRVKITRDGVGVFLGYIDNLRATLNDIQVFCIGMLGLFNRRLITTNITATAANTAIAAILATVNGVDDTGISIGTNTVTDSFWDTDTSGQAASASGTSKTTTQMRQEATFTNWDFTDETGEWEIVEGVSYPTLQWFVDRFTGKCIFVTIPK